MLRCAKQMALSVLVSEVQSRPDARVETLLRKGGMILDTTIPYPWSNGWSRLTPRNTAPNALLGPPDGR